MIDEGELAACPAKSEWPARANAPFLQPASCVQTVVLLGLRPAVQLAASAPEGWPQRACTCLFAHCALACLLVHRHCGRCGQQGLPTFHTVHWPSFNPPPPPSTHTRTSAHHHHTPPPLAGIVDKAADLDVSMVMGMGFPAYRGGLIFWADLVGAGACCVLRYAALRCAVRSLLLACQWGQWLAPRALCVFFFGRGGGRWHSLFGRRSGRVRHCASGSSKEAGVGWDEVCVCVGGAAGCMPRNMGGVGVGCARELPPCAASPGRLSSAWGSQAS